MANVLCQVHGSKTVALYPPSDAVHLQIPLGLSSSPMSVWADNTKDSGVINNKRKHTKATLNGADIPLYPSRDPEYRDQCLLQEPPDKLLSWERRVRQPGSTTVRKRKQGY